MEGENYIVSSEIYEEYNYATDCIPVVHKNNIVSRFPFTLPITAPSIDLDGDFVVQRKSNLTNQINFIEIEHCKGTVLGLVGLQVWRGAFLLSDWLIHNGCNLPESSIILELGSGTGLTSIVAAMYSSVVCTDINKGDILKLMESNINRNKNILKHPVKVLELDFTSNSFSNDIDNVLQHSQVILAADVIYDNELTEAFVKTIEQILSHNSTCTIYVALEKRYVFTIDDCDIIAPCYEYFLECLSKVDSITSEEIQLDFPQIFKYDRVKELVLWRIVSKSR